MTIKENWEKTDEVCPACGAVTKKAAGITKQNMKKMFSFNLKRDWVETVIIIGICFLALAYQHDTAAYREFMNHQYEYCTQLLSNMEYGNGEGMWNGTWNNAFGNGTDRTNETNETEGTLLSYPWNLTQ